MTVRPKISSILRPLVNRDPGQTNLNYAPGHGAILWQCRPTEHRVRRAFLLLTLAVASAVQSWAAYPWMVLPPTPALPEAEHSGFAPVNGVRLWYAEFGQGPPVILLHGGLANSNYWGLQVRALAPTYHVIVLDSRGHGRSSRTAAPIGYHAMASDVLALMDYLHLAKAAIVGWSDGAIIGLDITIHHPERVARIYAFAAN